MSSPTPTFSILAVCVGNLCRSPLAERLLTLTLDPARFSVSSAGTAAPTGRPMDASAARELARLGGTSQGFVSRRLEPGMVEGASLVLAASIDVRAQVLAISPSALHRTFTMTEFAELVARPDAAERGDPAGFIACAARHRSLVSGAAGLDLRDPIGCSPEVHREVADRIHIAVTAISRAMNRVGTGDR